MTDNSLRRRRPYWLLLPIAILIGLMIELRPGTSAAKAPSTAAAKQPVPVSVATAQQQSLPLWLDAIGTVTSMNAVNVRSRVDGQLQKMSFTEGQQIKAGDLLAVIDPKPLRATLAQVQGVLAQEQAKLASNQVDLKRATALANANAGSTQTVDTLKAQVAAQSAAVQSAKASVDSARLQLSYTRVVSPVNGRAGQRLVPVGSTVHATDVIGLTTVTQMNPIWVTFSVPQDVLPSVLQQSSSKQLKVSALDRADAHSLAEGELVFVDSQVTPANGQVQLKARFDNKGLSLWPGSLVGVRMLVQTQENAVVVPQQAVQQGSTGNFVYLATAQHKVEVRPVVVGAMVKGMQWIHSGLQVGDVVVTQGQSRLAAGADINTGALQ